LDYLLLTVALFAIFAAGLGSALLLLPTRRTNVCELLGLSFICGTAFISLGSFGLGFLLTGAALRWTLMGLCLALGACGLAWRGQLLRNLEKPTKYPPLWWQAALAAQLIIVFYLSYRLWLGWDALLIWELKARVAYLNGGVIPLDFFTNSTRIWPHTSYPLLLSLSESWLYGWLGRPSQEMVKWLFPFFYLAAVGLLCTAGWRYGARRWQAIWTPLLLFFVPLTWLGEGSATSGYADFPLGVCYLAAIIYALEYRQTGSYAALRLTSLLGAVLCWIKEEGAILWLCLLAVMMIEVLRRRQWARVLTLLAPGILLLGTWRGFLSYMRAPRWTAFLPFTPTTLWANLDRAPVILLSILKESLHLERWGWLWWAVIIVALWAIMRARCTSGATLRWELWLAVLLPISCYAGIYFFSAFNPVTVHIDSSLARLLLHIAPVALLFVMLSVVPTPITLEQTEASPSSFDRLSTPA
jgi:hypothetical protein